MTELELEAMIQRAAEAGAKNMLAHVIKMGICAPLDILIRADIFPIHQMGVYAYNEWDW